MIGVWILLGLLGGLWFIRLALIQGQMIVRGTYALDGVLVPVTLHFGSKYPKLWGHQGVFAGKGNCCFRGYPVDSPLQVVGVPPVTKRLVAHELSHDVRRRKEGFIRFWWATLWELRLPYAKRTREVQAQADAEALLTGTLAGVDAHTLLDQFR